VNANEEQPEPNTHLGVTVEIQPKEAVTHQAQPCPDAARIAEHVADVVAQMRETRAQNPNNNGSDGAT